MDEQRFEELLADYVGGELDPARVAEFERALRSNARWQARADSLRDTHAALAALAPGLDDCAIRAAGVAGRVAARGGAPGPGRGGRIIRFRQWGALVGYAAVIVAAFGGGVVVGRSGKDGGSSNSLGDHRASAPVAPVTPRLVRNYARAAEVFPGASTFTRALLTIANR